MPPRKPRTPPTPEAPRRIPRLPLTPLQLNAARRLGAAFGHLWASHPGVDQAIESASDPAHAAQGAEHQLLILAHHTRKAHPEASDDDVKGPLLCNGLEIRDFAPGVEWFVYPSGKVMLNSAEPEPVGLAARADIQEVMAWQCAAGDASLTTSQLPALEKALAALEGEAAAREALLPWRLLAELREARPEPRWYHLTTTRPPGDLSRALEEVLKFRAALGAMADAWSNPEAPTEQRVEARIGVFEALGRPVPEAVRYAVHGMHLSVAAARAAEEETNV